MCIRDRPSGGFQGQATDMEIRTRLILDLKKRLNKIYAANTGQKLSVIEKAMERDNFMTPEEAKKFGLIDHIVTSVSYTHLDVYKRQDLY